MSCNSICLNELKQQETQEYHAKDEEGPRSQPSIKMIFLDALCSVQRLLRAIFSEYRESKDTHKKSNFFLFCQNIPLGKLIQEKVIQSSNELFNGRKF